MALELRNLYDSLIGFLDSSPTGTADTRSAGEWVLEPDTAYAILVTGRRANPLDDIG